MKKMAFVAAATVCAVAAPAFAETYRAVQASASNVVYLVPETRQKDGDTARVSVVAILEEPRASGVIAQELPMDVNCRAKTFRQIETIDLGVERNELGRRPANGQAQTAPKGTLGDIVVDYACNARLPEGDPEVFQTFTQALIGTRQYIAANREHMKNKAK